ncbi:MAG: extracellular solute-binding protein [Proteobacteria bacterium]|nr:extracellular solute-binding protein [Pseudomonadota bacterium]
MPPGGAPLAAPAILPPRPALRVLGTAVTQNETIRARAVADLGFDIEFITLDGVAAQQMAVRSPGGFDIYDQWFHSLDVVWWAGVLQPVDTRRIQAWDQIIHRDQALRMTGRVDRSETMPLSGLYVSPDRRLGIHRTEAVTAVPGVYNVDAFGYLPGAVEAAMNGDAESWGWLLDPRLAGKVALVADPTIGAAEAALALTAQGLAEFADPADLSIAEIDTMVRILIQRKKAGHFHTLWQSVSDIVPLMEAGTVVIGSLWASALSDLWSRGVDVRNAVPVEGYRGWHGCMALSGRTEGRALDAAYAYLNWWLAGWVGAQMTRYGLYVSASDNVRGHLSEPEWSFWYEGKPASMDLPGPDGSLVVAEGTSRSGGSVLDRISRIALWNTTMREHNYLVRRWNQFLES